MCGRGAGECQGEAEQLIDFYDADPSRIEIVAPGVDHALFSTGSQAGARWALRTSDAPILLFIGRIQPLKGVDVAVQMLAKLDRTDARLWIVGAASGQTGDAEVDRVNQMIAELGLTDRVEFIPPQPHHLLSTYYRAADICLVPSRSESFGLVALEAAACGVPVIASAVGGLVSLVQHGRTGYLVDSRDPAEYAAWANAILADPVHARRLAVSAAARARTYTWSTSAARLRRLYEDLAANTSPPATDPMTDSMTPPSDLAALAETFQAWLGEQLVDNPAVAAAEPDQSGPNRWFVRLLGDERDSFTVHFHLDQRTLRYETYFCPAPEENREEFFAHVLRRNASLYGAAFCIGAEEAVYLKGQMANGLVRNPDELDRVLGSLYVWTEQFFRPAMRIGFATRFKG